jgi:hypothetical protein
MAFYHDPTAQGAGCIPGRKRLGGDPNNRSPAKSAGHSVGPEASLQVLEIRRYSVIPVATHILGGVIEGNVKQETIILKI